MPDNAGINILPQFNGPQQPPFRAGYTAMQQPTLRDNYGGSMGQPQQQFPNNADTFGMQLSPPSVGGADYFGAFNIPYPPLGGYPQPGDWRQNATGNGINASWRDNALGTSGRHDINVNSFGGGGYPQSVGSIYNINRTAFSPSFQQLLFPGSRIGPTGNGINTNQTPTPLRRDSHAQGMGGVQAAMFNNVRARNII